MNMCLYITEHFVVHLRQTHCEPAMLQQKEKLKEEIGTPPIPSTLPPVIRKWSSSILSHIQWDLRTSRCAGWIWKSRGTRYQIDNIPWIVEKARESKKSSTSASLTMLKPLIVWITTNCRKFLKRREYQGRSQDGGGIGRGVHFLFYKFIERTTER